MEGILNTHLLDMTLCKEIRDGTFGLKTPQSVLEPTGIPVTGLPGDSRTVLVY